MAFIVEDGSIVAGANAYIDVAFYKSYWNDRGGHGNHSDEQKQAAIIIATQYVDNNFAWRGDVINDDQPLDWPRSGVYDDENRALDNDTIPNRLKYAVAEYTKRQLNLDIQPDVQYSLESGALTSISQEVVGAVKESKNFDVATGRYFGLKRYPSADNWLRGLTKGGVVGSFGSLRRC